MNRSFDVVMTEHPAWQATAAGMRRVFATPDGGRHLFVTTGRDLLPAPLAGDRAASPVLDEFTMPEGAAREVPELAAVLGELGTVARFRNSDLWDAIGTAIIRQVIRAAQSKKLYRAFCAAATA